jgi:hypothetical protein
VAECKSFDISANISVNVFGLNQGLHFRLYSCIYGRRGVGCGGQLSSPISQFPLVQR